MALKLHLCFVVIGGGRVGLIQKKTKSVVFSCGGSRYPPPERNAYRALSISRRFKILEGVAFGLDFCSSLEVGGWLTYGKHRNIES